MIEGFSYRPDPEEARQVTPETQVFDKQSWPQVQDAITALTSREFHQKPDDPILGEIIDGNDVVSYPNLAAAFCAPETTVVLMRTPQEVIGYTFAIPIGSMDPRRALEPTAYIYYTVIEESYRGRGLVGPLTDHLFETLLQQGYSYVEIDARLEYAKKIERNYEESIVEKSDIHDRFSLGRDYRSFRIDIDRHLTK